MNLWSRICSIHYLSIQLSIYFIGCSRLRCIFHQINLLRQELPSKFPTKYDTINLFVLIVNPPSASSYFSMALNCWYDGVAEVKAYRLCWDLNIQVSNLNLICVSIINFHAYWYDWIWNARKNYSLLRYKLNQIDPKWKT